MPAPVFGMGRRKFGRIYQRFWFARCRGSRRLQSESSFPVSHVLSGIGILHGQNEGTRCINFFSHSPCCRYRFPPAPSPRAAAQRHAGGAEGLCARCSALLPPGDRSGRLHRSGLPSAKPSQIQPGLRSGAEKPRAIEPHPTRHRCGPVIGLFGRGRNLRAIADSIGFGRVFPYMGFAIRPHARLTGACEITVPRPM